MTQRKTSTELEREYIAAINALREGRPLRTAQVETLTGMKRGAVAARLNKANGDKPEKDGRAAIWKADVVLKAFPSLAVAE